MPKTEKLEYETRPDFTEDELESREALEAALASMGGEGPLSFSESTPIHTVGAWAGSATFKNPAKYIDFARSHRINRIDLMINDFAKSRSCDDFRMRDKAAIIEIASACAEAGVELHLTSWLLPCQRFIDQAADALRPLFDESPNIHSIVWDAEEPWTRNKGGQTARVAAEQVADRFAGVPMGVTGITFVNEAKLRPLAEKSRDLIPQAYATIKNNQDPSRLVRLANNLWESRVGKRPNIMGLAAYRQPDDPAPAMAASIKAAKELGIDTVCYWSLHHLTKNPQCAEYVASVREDRTGALIADLDALNKLQAKTLAELDRITRAKQKLLNKLSG